MNRTFISSLIYAPLIFAGVFLAGNSMAADKIIKVKAGHLVALDMAPLFVAAETDCFTKNGIEVETVFFANPGDNNAALAGGAIDFSTNPFTLPFFAANSGVPLKVISAAGGWGVMEVVAQKELNLSSISELKAYTKTQERKLKIATLQGDTLELILTREFEKNDISLKDVELIYFNDLLAMVESFRNGQVDILSHIKPYTSEMVASKGATVLTNNAQTWSNSTPNTVVSVLDETLVNRPNVVQAYLKGLICAAKLINDDPEKATEILDKGNYFRVDKKVLAGAFKSAPAPISFVPDVAAVQSVVSDLSALGYIKGNTKAVDIFALEMIKSLEE